MPRASARSADDQRLDSHMLAIADEACGFHKRAPDGSHRFKPNDSLCIYPSAFFVDFSSAAHTARGRGGRALLAHLSPDLTPSDFLAAHPGLGPFTPNADPDPDEDLLAEERCAYRQQLYDSADPYAPLPRQYFAWTRKLPLPPELDARIRFIAHRSGGGTMLVPLTAGPDGDVVAFHCTDIAADAGNLKDDHGRSRRRILPIRRQWSRQGAVFLGAPGPVAVIVEGLEKGLAALAAGFAFVIVTGSISNTPEIPSVVRRLIIGRDADAPDSQGDQSLWRAVVRYLGQGIEEVVVTRRPNELVPAGSPVLKDLDDVWRTLPTLLQDLLNNATLDHGRLSEAVKTAILDETARLAPGERSRASKEVAKLLQIGSVKALDAAISSHRAKIRREGLDNVDTRPRILIDDTCPEIVVKELDALLVASGGLYLRGNAIVRVILDQDGFGAHELKAKELALEIHERFRPYEIISTPIGPVEQDAAMIKHLGICDMWLGKPKKIVPELRGICTTPLLRENGAIHSTKGYDPVTKLYCVIDDVVISASNRVPLKPTRGDAGAALARTRCLFRTIPHAGANLVKELIGNRYVDVIDTSKPAALSESSFIAGTMTVLVYRSLDGNSPGHCTTAPKDSGSGLGKGQLGKIFVVLSGGASIARVTKMSEYAELDKRITDALLKAIAILGLDNINGVTLSSDILAVAHTEREYTIRKFGVLESLTLRLCPFTYINGNGLLLSNDLARRMLRSQLYRATEHPEDHTFLETLEAIAIREREQLLIDLLTIWRWGRQGFVDADKNIKCMRPGSYEQWAEWIALPLVRLGCEDPCNSFGVNARDDPNRSHTYFVFRKWRHYHKGDWVKLGKLHPAVKEAINSKVTTYQAYTDWVNTHRDTRASGFQLVAHEKTTLKGVNSYEVKWVGEGDAPEFDSDGDPIEFKRRAK